MAKNSMKPRIRFKGFTDAWEQRKAKTLFISYAEKGYPELPVLSATQDKGMVYRDDTGKNIFHDKNNEISYKRVQPGQFVIHLRSFQGGFAHSNILGITSPAYTIFGFKDDEKQCDLYWKYVFCSSEFVKRLETVTYGIRDGRSISYDEFLTMKFIVPKYEEQVQIASILIEIDNLITLHQRKYDKFVNIKKALLEKMFPQGDETTPKIRFKGFTDAWEQREFNSIAKRITEMTDTEDLPRVEYEDIVSGQGTLNKDINKKKSCKTGILFDNGDVLFGKLRPYLKNWLFATFMGIAVGDFWVLRANNADGLYIYTLLQIDAFQDIANQSTGTKMPRADWSLVSKQRFLTPTVVPEQRKIGEFFKQLDNLITLHQRQLEKLKNIKSALLEKMFV